MAISNAYQVQNLVAASRLEKDSEQRIELENLINRAASNDRCECIYEYPIRDAVRDELISKRYKLSVQGHYTIISWYPDSNTSKTK